MGDAVKLDGTYLMTGATAPPQRDSIVRVAAIEDRSFVAGPGARTVVWVAGCLRRCPGCMKPDLFDFGAGNDMAVDELAARILSVPALDGVTFSGGEPFEQAVALGAVAQRLKARGFHVAAYSGYRLEALQADPIRFGPLLSSLDMLIDGEYRHDLPGPFPLKGSANQHIHEFNTLSNISLVPTAPAQHIQLTMRNCELRLSGFPDKRMEEALRQSLRDKGIRLEAR